MKELKRRNLFMLIYYSQAVIRASSEENVNSIGAVKNFEGSLKGVVAVTGFESNFNKMLRMKSFQKNIRLEYKHLNTQTVQR